MPATKVFKSTQLTGGINTTASPDGLQVFPERGVPFRGTQFRDCENFFPLDRGGLKKVHGFSLYLSTGVSSPITGITRFQKSDGTNQFIYSQGTSVYRQGSGTPIATVANGANINFCTGNNLLVICDGVNQTQWWDGTTITANANASLPTATVIPAFYQNRFWFTTNTSPNQSNVYYSKANDITLGYGDGSGSGGFVQCDYNDGDTIVGMVPSFLSQSLNPVLAIAKNRKFGIIADLPISTTTIYSFASIDNVIGASSPRSLCRVGQDIFYFNKLGLTAARTQVNYNQLFAEYLSVDVSNQFSANTISTLSNAILFYDWLRYRVCVAVNEVGFSYPNVLWCYDLRLGCWYKERWGNPNNITAVFIDTDGTWYHGDSNGNIYVHGPQYASFNNAVITSFFTLPYIDFGDPSAWKQIGLMTAALTGGATANVMVSHSLDFGARNGPGNSLQPSQAPYVWGGGVWTNNPNVYQWGAATFANRRFWPKGYFRNISSTFTHSDTSNSLEIFALSYDIQFTSHR